MIRQIAAVCDRRRFAFLFFFFINSCSFVHLTIYETACVVACLLPPLSAPMFATSAQFKREIMLSTPSSTACYFLCTVRLWRQDAVLCVYYLLGSHHGNLWTTDSHWIWTKEMRFFSCLFHCFFDLSLVYSNCIWSWRDFPKHWLFLYILYTISFRKRKHILHGIKSVIKPSPFSSCFFLGKWNNFTFQ